MKPQLRSIRNQELVVTIIIVVPILSDKGNYFLQI